ncbi:MAG TPA: indole-3-glycerol-phosphate synthase [Nitrososphaeraceae archaeon]|nr:indole-3-glycerol-phosphate synthase [Nitrososphaeraceae archaeon]
MSRFFSPDSESNLIEKLVKNSFRSIDEGLYEVANFDHTHDAMSLTNNIRSMINIRKVPIITEVKFSSPSKGNIVDSQKVNPVNIANQMIGGGAIGLSVLTQKYFFNGSINNFIVIRKNTSVPMLMKDIIVSENQIDCAKEIGADYVLLIKTVFDKNLAEASIEKFSEYSYRKGLNILYEVHLDDEFKEILDFKVRRNDLIGINNRNLDNLKIDLKTTENLLKKYDKGRNLIVSESGIENTEQIRYLKKAGADAFLIGTSIMEKAENISSKVKELVNDTSSY